MESSAELWSVCALGYHSLSLSILQSMYTPWRKNRDIYKQTLDMSSTWWWKQQNMAKLNIFFPAYSLSSRVRKEWWVKMVCDDCSGDTNINAPPYQLSYGSDDEFIRHRKLKNFIQRKCMKSPGNSRWFEN